MLLSLKKIAINLNCVSLSLSLVIGVECVTINDAKKAKGNNEKEDFSVAEFVERPSKQSKGITIQFCIDT